MREVERKYVLRNLPIAAKEGPGSLLGISNIRQYYEGDYRYRAERTVSVKYYRIKKVNVGVPGVNDELDITEIDFTEFIEHAKGKNVIDKTRYTFSTGDDKQILTVDLFKNIHLVMMEIEIPAIDYPVDIPENISREIIADVTELPGFSNRNLIGS